MNTQYFLVGNKETEDSYVDENSETLIIDPISADLISADTACNGRNTTDRIYNTIRLIQAFDQLFNEPFDDWDNYPSHIKAIKVQRDLLGGAGRPLVSYLDDENSLSALVVQWHEDFGDGNSQTLFYIACDDTLVQLDDALPSLSLDKFDKLAAALDKEFDNPSCEDVSVNYFPAAAFPHLKGQLVTHSSKTSRVEMVPVIRVSS